MIQKHLCKRRDQGKSSLYWKQWQKSRNPFLQVVNAILLLSIALAMTNHLLLLFVSFITLNPHRSRPTLSWQQQGLGGGEGGQLLRPSWSRTTPRPQPRAKQFIQQCKAALLFSGHQRKNPGQLCNNLQGLRDSGNCNRALGPHQFPHLGPGDEELVRAAQLLIPRQLEPTFGPLGGLQAEARGIIGARRWQQWAGQLGVEDTNQCIL